MVETLYYNPTPDESEQVDLMVERSNGQISYDQAYAILGVEPINNKHHSEPTPELHRDLNDANTEKSIAKEIYEAIRLIGASNSNLGLHTLNDSSHPNKQNINPRLIEEGLEKAEKQRSAAEARLKRLMATSAFIGIIGEIPEGSDIVPVVQDRLFGDKEKDKKRNNIYRELRKTAGIKSKSKRK